MKKILLALISVLALLSLTGCNIEYAKRSNPDCTVYPIFGNSSCQYIMHDTGTDTIKYVRITDNGTIAATYGSFTLEEYYNNKLTMITLKLGDTYVETPVHWTKNDDEWQFYVNNNRLMMFDRRDGETRQVFHFAELKTSELRTLSRGATAANAGRSDIDYSRYVTATNYVTVTNYVDVSKGAFRNIDFSFHD